MARTDPQMNIRLPSDLKERIEAAASENNRSMNAEIVRRLERSFFTGYMLEMKDNYSYSEVENLYNQMENRMNKLEDIIVKALEKK